MGRDNTNHEGVMGAILQSGLPTEQESPLTPDPVSIPEYADYAEKQNGTLGRIAVAVETIREVKAELGRETQNITGKELTFYAEVLEELEEVMVSIGAEYLDEVEPYSGEANTLKSREDESDREFIELTIDRISGSGNLVAVGAAISRKHVLVTHGRVGEKVVVETDSGGIVSKKLPECGSKRVLALPFPDAETANTKTNTAMKPQIKEGESIRLKPSSSESGELICKTPSFDNIKEIRTADRFSRSGYITVEIQEIEDKIAFATITSRTSARRRKRSKKSKKKQSSKKPRGRRRMSSNPNPFSDARAASFRSEIARKKI